MSMSFHEDGGHILTTYVHIKYQTRYQSLMCLAKVSVKLVWTAKLYERLVEYVIVVCLVRLFQP